MSLESIKKNPFFQKCRNLEQTVCRKIRVEALMIRNKFCVKSYDGFDFKQIPIIINNYNRLTFPKRLIEKLRQLGYNNLYIIDNKSTYPPLLEYYETTDVKVFRLDENVGHLSLWKAGICRQFRNQWYVYTDSDVVPGDRCPEDFIERLYKLAEKYKAVKAGLAIAIDDLPDCYAQREDVAHWESDWWKNELEPDVYEADIDTTFALYRPNFKGGSGKTGRRIRVAGDMTARHLPWYVDSENPDEEEQYYINTCSAVASWVKDKDVYAQR